MRAIILHAVRAEEFAICKLKITKRTDMKVNDILGAVKEHFLAVRTNEDIIGTKPNSKQVAFATNVKRNESNEATPIGIKIKAVTPSLLFLMTFTKREFLIFLLKMKIF